MAASPTPTDAIRLFRLLREHAKLSDQLEELTGKLRKIDEKEIAELIPPSYGPSYSALNQARRRSH
jgi:hypothetical protein